MLNEIQSPRWDSALRRLFGVKQTNVSPTLSPEILPVAIIQPHEPEMYHLTGERLVGGLATGPAVAARFAYVELASRQDVVLTIEELVLHSATAVSYWIGWSPNLSGAAQGTAFLDSRRGVTTAVAQNLGTLFNGTLVALGGGVFWQRTAPANTEIVVRQPIIVANGARLYIQCTTANTVFFSQWTWRERQLEREEVGP